MIDAQGNDLETDKVYMVGQGLLNAWFCAPKHMTLEQVQNAVDRDIPGQGTLADRWIVEARDCNHPPELECGEEIYNHKFCTKVSPGYCAETPDSRQHWVAYC